MSTTFGLTPYTDTEPESRVSEVYSRLMGQHTVCPVCDERSGYGICPRHDNLLFHRVPAVDFRSWVVTQRLKYLLTTVEAG